jgi:hypothetical protein
MASSDSECSGHRFAAEHGHDNGAGEAGRTRAGPDAAAGVGLNIASVYRAAVLDGESGHSLSDRDGVDGCEHRLRDSRCCGSEVEKAVLGKEVRRATVGTKMSNDCG